MAIRVHGHEDSRRRLKVREELQLVRKVKMKHEGEVLSSLLHPILCEFMLRHAF